MRQFICIVCCKVCKTNGWTDGQGQFLDRTSLATNLKYFTCWLKIYGPLLVAIAFVSCFVTEGTHCTDYKMAGPLKASTDLAGLAVAHYPHKMLSVIYQKILRTIGQMPESYVYRKNTQVT